LTTCIKTFEDVFTYKFIELLVKRQALERNVHSALIEYDNQVQLSKMIKKKREQLDNAVQQKRFSAENHSRIETTHWVLKSTPRYNMLCKYSGCYSNCHPSCKLQNEVTQTEFVKNCIVIKGTDKCFVCDHSYKFHYLNNEKYVSETKSESIVGEDIELATSLQTAKDNQERARVVYKGLESKLQASEERRVMLSEELLRGISEYESLGIARNYTKLIESQLNLIETHIEGNVGPETEDLRKTQEELRKKLIVVQEARRATVVD